MNGCLNSCMEIRYLEEKEREFLRSVSDEQIKTKSIAEIKSLIQDRISLSDTLAGVLAERIKNRTAAF